MGDSSKIRGNNKIIDGNSAMVPRGEYSSCKLYEGNDNKSKKLTNRTHIVLC